MKNSFINKLFFKNKADISFSYDEPAQSELVEDNKGVIKKILAFFKLIIPKIRFGFAAACENSHIVCFVEELYARILSCQTRVLGVYFMTFTLASALIKYFSFSNLISFIFSNEIIPLLFGFIISLILLTSKKEIGKLITKSILLSDFRITYSQVATAAFYTAKTPGQGFSTAFFLGVFTSFLTIFYPISSIICFFATILFLLCSINRPESTLLISIFLIPFLNTKGLFIIILITFFSLFYKFMRCKRHISFGFTEVLLLLLAICFVVSTSLANESVIIFIKYVLPLILSVVCMNIVRSTSMLESCYKILIKLITLFSIIILALYISTIIFGYNRVMTVADSDIFSSFLATIKNEDFSVTFIAISVPLVFVRLISSRMFLHLFTLIILLLYSSVFCTFTEILVILLSCLAILCFYNFKSAFLIVFLPFISFILTLPKNYLTQLLQIKLPRENTAFVLDKVISQFKNNFMFGNGFISEKLINSGFGSLILSCGFIGTAVFLTLIIRIIIKNIKFSVKFDLSKTAIKSISIGLCVSTTFFLIMSLFAKTFADLRCICLFAIISSLTRNVQRCIKADFIDRYSVREYET